MITGAGVLPRPLNLPIIMATVLIAAVAVIGANLIVDTLSAVIDPRIRLT